MQCDPSLVSTHARACRAPMRPAREARFAGALVGGANVGKRQVQTKLMNWDTYLGHLAGDQQIDRHGRGKLTYRNHHG
jgi:hypothetical protein